MGTGGLMYFFNMVYAPNTVEKRSEYGHSP